MKVTIEVDCTPQEARTFLGLPDVEKLNDVMVKEVTRRFEETAHQMKPEEMLKSWTQMGVMAQDQFLKMMQGAASASMAKGWTDPRSETKSD
jgi:hypothetical protein